jgi:hypothetical protein
MVQVKGPTQNTKTEVDDPHPLVQREDGEWEVESSTRLISWVKLHVLGLTHVTHEARSSPLESPVLPRT